MSKTSLIVKNVIISKAEDLTKCLRIRIQANINLEHNSQIA